MTTSAFTTLKATVLRWLIALMALAGALSPAAMALDPNVKDLKELRCLGLPGMPINPITKQKMMESEISTLIPDPCAWYAQTFNTIGPGGLNIFYLAANVGLLLVVVGLVMHVLRDGLSGNTSKMGPAVIRAVIAAAVISQTASLQTAAYTTFMTAYTASESALKQDLENTMQQATAGFLTNVNTIANLSFVGKGFAWALQGAKFLAAGKAAESQTGDNKPTDGEAFKAIWLITIPYMAVYAVTLYGFIITFILFAAALPMAAGWMSFAGSSKLLVTNIMAMVGATFGIMFLPVSFNIGVNIAYVQPMNKMNALASEYEAKRQAILRDANQLDAEARTEFDKLMNGETDVEPKQWYDRLGDTIRQKFQGLAAPIQELALYAEKTVKQGIYGLALTFFGCLVGVTVMTMVPAIAMRAFVGYSGGTGGGSSPRTGGMTGMGRGASGGKSAGSTAGSAAGTAARSIGATAAARLGAGAVAQAGSHGKHQQAMGVLNDAMNDAKSERAAGGGGSTTSAATQGGASGSEGGESSGGESSSSQGSSRQASANQSGSSESSESGSGSSSAGAATQQGAGSTQNAGTAAAAGGAAGAVAGSAGGPAGTAAGGAAGAVGAGSASSTESGLSAGAQTGGAVGSEATSDTDSASASSGAAAIDASGGAEAESAGSGAGGTEAGSGSQDSAAGSSAAGNEGAASESAQSAGNAAPASSAEAEQVAPGLSGNNESAEDAFAASREHARTGAALKQAEQAYDYAQENKKSISPEQFRAAKSNYEQALGNHRASEPAQQSEVRTSARALANATLNEQETGAAAKEKRATLASEERAMQTMQREKANEETMNQQRERVQAARLESERATATHRAATSARKQAEDNYRTSTNGAYMVKGAVGGRRAVAAMAAVAVSGGQRVQQARQQVKDTVQRAKGHPDDVQARAKQAAFEATIGKAQRYTPAAQRTEQAMAAEPEPETVTPRSAGRK